MGFFAQFYAWLNTILAGYIGTMTGRVSGALAPAIVTLGVLYVLVWGYLMMTGQIEEPFVSGVKRILTLALLLGGALQLWLYNTVIVDTFFNGPIQLGAAILNADDPVTVVDKIMLDGAQIGEGLWERGGIFDGNFSFYVAGGAVFIILGLTAIYTFFLLCLARIALSVLLALGPLFIALLVFQSTKTFFQNWLAQLANYAFVTILTTLLAALMMTFLRSVTDDVAVSGDVSIAQVLRVCLAAALAFLIMRQVLQMSSGLASGVALVTHGAVSSLLFWGLGRADRGMQKNRERTREFRRGLFSAQPPSPGYSAASRAGYRLQRGVRRLVQRPNTIQPA